MALNSLDWDLTGLKLGWIGTCLDWNGIKLSELGSDWADIVLDWDMFGLE